MKPKKLFVSLMTCLLVISSCFTLTTRAYTSTEPNIDYIDKNAAIIDDPRAVEIVVDAQYEAIPRPKILFWQANFCSYHGTGSGKGLTTQSVVDCLNAAYSVGDVDYYIDAYDSKTETQGGRAREYLWPTDGSVKSFDHDVRGDTPITVADVPNVDNTTSYHVLNQASLERLLLHWEEAAATGDSYDYLIILYDGLVASGAPSSANYYPYAYTIGNGVNLSDEEYARRLEIAKELSEIPTLHITAPKADGENMHLDTVSYKDYHLSSPRNTYRSYAESVADYEYRDGYDYSKYDEHSNHRLTTILMLNALAYVNPAYYLEIVDQTTGKLKTIPTAEQFRAHMPAYHSYMDSNLAVQVQEFLTVNNIIFSDTLAAGLKYTNVKLQYCNTDWDYDGEPEWIEIPSSDYTLTKSGDSSHGTKLTADINFDTSSMNYYAKRIRMVITAEASPDFGLSGDPVKTNVGNAEVKYFGIDGSLLFNQTNASPKVQWDIYNVSYDMGTHGAVKDPTTGIKTDGDSGLPYEDCKNGYSPRRVVGENVDESNVTVNTGYYLVGFTCDTPVLVRGENDSRAADSLIKLADINSIVVTSDIVLTAVYEEDKNVHYQADPHGTITGIITETVRENSNPIGTTVEPDDNYILTGFTANVSVTLNNGTVYAANTLIPADAITSVKIKQDTTFTAKFVRQYTVTYDAADHGTFTEDDLTDNVTSEIVLDGGSPTYGISGSDVSVIYREGGYLLTGFVCDKDVWIDGDSAIRTAGSVIDESEITSILIDDDITLTAQYIYNVNVPTGVIMNSPAGYLPILVLVAALAGCVIIRPKKSED